MIHIFNLQSSNCNPHAGRLHWFSFEKCFKNLLDTIDFTGCKLHIVFDGNSTGHFVEKYKQHYPFELHHIDSQKDMFKSNTLMYEYIKNQEMTLDDIVYTVEWDYLHTPEWIKAVKELYVFNPNYKMDETYVSIYCHPDKFYFRQNTDDYLGMYKDLKSAIYIGNYGYWMTTPSTCNSFLMKRSLFDKDYDILSLPKADNERFPILVNGRKREVLQPLFGFATHCDPSFLTPFINWEKISEDTKLL